MTVDYWRNTRHNGDDMPKIFTIGFSGKSPDVFMEVLDAVRVRAVWDIRLWRTSTYGHFTVAKIWPRHWGRDMNTIQNSPQHQKFWPVTKTAILPGLIMNECAANYWLHATRPRDFPRLTLTASAFYVPRKVPHNATAASPLNTLRSTSSTLRLHICNVIYHS